MGIDGLYGVMGATGVITATVANEGAEHQLVESDESLQDFLHRLTTLDQCFSKELDSV